MFLGKCRRLPPNHVSDHRIGRVFSVSVELAGLVVEAMGIFDKLRGIFGIDPEPASVGLFNFADQVDNFPAGKIWHQFRGVSIPRSQ